jgi:DNA-binding transcriptional ArsR family regulator
VTSVASAADLDRGTAPSDESRLSRDEVFDVLSSRRRRNVIHALRNSGLDGATVGDLSRRLAAWENDHDDERSVTAKERKRVYTALRQTHLPKLQEVGVVEYDPDRGTVSLSPCAADLCPYLREPDRRPWPLYYALVGLAGGALSLLVATGVLDVLGGIVPVLLVSIAVLAVAGVHYRITRPATRDHLAIVADTVPSLDREAPADADED